MKNWGVMDMNDRIKQTFDKIYAENELKTQTKALIAYQIRKKHKNRMRRHMVSVIACFLFFIIYFSLCLANTLRFY